MAQTIRFSPRGTAVPPGNIPTDASTGFTAGLSTWTFGEAMPAGEYVDGTPFMVSERAFTLVVTPESESVTGPNGQPAWVHGLTVNGGAVGTQLPGNNNSGVGSSMIAGDTRTGWPGGVQLQPQFLSPPNVAQNGEILNVDSGVTSEPFARGGGWTGSLTKFVSNLSATSPTARLRETHVLHVVSEAPPLGAFPPAVSSPDKTPVIFWEDVDLSGLPNWAMVTPFGYDTTRWPNLDLSTVQDEIPRYNWGRDQLLAVGADTYGPNLANWMGFNAMALLADIPLAHKERIAQNFITMAINVVGRLRQGGQLTGFGGVGGHLHQWPLCVAVAAWLTRNSTRGQYFRDFLSGPFASQLATHFGAPRVVEALDWLRPVSVFPNGREAPFGNVDPGYFSHQPRPGMEGEVWSNPNRNSPGSGIISQRLGQRDYMFIQFGTALGMALFLSKVVGGRALVPYPNYWRFMDMLADVAIWFAPLSTDDTTDSPGEYKLETWLVSTEIRPAVSAALGNPTWGWPHPTFSSANITAVWHTPAFELLREIRDGSSVYGVEHVVSLKSDVLLSRNPAWLPPKEAFTVLRNGSPVALDLTGATGGDARTNGAIQIRGGTIMLMLGTPTLPGDVITVTTNFAAFPDSRPRTATGTLLQDITAVTATLKPYTQGDKPNPLQTVSFGGFETAVGGVANDGSDPAKLLSVPRRATFLTQKFGSDLLFQRWRRALIGIRGRMAPGGRSRVQNACWMGQRVATTNSALFVQNSANLLSLRLASSGGNQTVGLGNLPTNIDGQDMTFWLSVNVDVGSSSARMRINDTVYSIVGFGAPWDIEADLPILFNFFFLSINAETTGNNPARLAIREMMIHVETSARPFGGPAGLVDISGAPFGPTADWGPRGGLILPDRPDYAGRDDNGEPEYFLAPTLAGVQGGQVPNLGVWGIMGGSVPFNPDFPVNWVQVA